MPSTKTTPVSIQYPDDEGDHLFILQEFPKLGSTESVGFHLYEASVLLAQYLALEYRPCDITTKRKRVLELGSGSCALAGLAMTWLNYQVTFSDLPGILPSLKINVERNARNFTEHDIIPLAWGRDNHDASLEDEFDLVIGADVVYQREFVLPLLETVSLYAKRDAIICSEEREEGLIDEYFVSEAKKLGFHVKRIKSKAFPKPFCDEDAKHMRIYKLQKSTSNSRG